MSAYRKIASQYSETDIENMIFDSTAPAHCTKCGSYIGDYEPDCQYMSSDKTITCHKCGPKTLIESALVTLGYM